MEKIKQITEKVKCTFEKICDSIKNVVTKYQYYKGLWDDPRGKITVKKAWDQLVYLLKKIKPAKIKGDIVFGAKDPATTGQAIGAVAALYGFMPKDLHITPDFENQRLEGNVKMKGKFRCVHLLIIIIKLVIDKNVRYIFGKIYNKEEIENE